MDKYGLIGFPLVHSHSKDFFAEKFRREGIDAVYENYEIPEPRLLLEIVKNNPSLRGLNCTIPHKQAIIPLLNELSPEAQEIGAVNVIEIQRQQNGDLWLKGYNTDIVGFTESIHPMLKPFHKKALILGTGGASKAIRAGLTRLGLEWKLVSRKGADNVFSYEDITPQLLQEYKVIVNCTPIGMYPHIDEAPNLPYRSMGQEHLLFDLIYNPEETEFMRRGAKAGAMVKNGLEMLQRQALASWKIWNP